MYRITFYVIVISFINKLFASLNAVEQDNSLYDSSLLVKKSERILVQHPCVRTFSVSGSIGCQSQKKIQAVIVNVEDDLQYINKISTDFVALLSGSFFNDSMISILKSTEHLAAIIVYDIPGDNLYLNTPGSKYSTDVVTPQGEGTSEGTLI
jgi:hypothetical protein